MGDCYDRAGARARLERFDGCAFLLPHSVYLFHFHMHSHCILIRQQLFVGVWELQKRVFTPESTTISVAGTNDQSSEYALRSFSQLRQAVEPLADCLPVSSLASLCESEKSI